MKQKAKSLVVKVKQTQNKKNFKRLINVILMEEDTLVRMDQNII